MRHGGREPMSWVGVSARIRAHGTQWKITNLMIFWACKIQNKVRRVLSVSVIFPWRQLWWAARTMKRATWPPRKISGYGVDVSKPLSERRPTTHKSPSGSRMGLRWRMELSLGRLCEGPSRLIGSVPFAHVAIDHSHSQQLVPRDFPLFKRCFCVTKSKHLRIK